MKRWILMVALGLAVAAGALAARQEVVIRRARVKVMAAPQFWGKSLREVSAGEKLPLVATERGWHKVKLGAEVGWLHQTCCVDRALAGGAGASGGEASSGEVALAARGFTPQIEAEYQRQNPDIKESFALVDKILGASEPDGEPMAEFIVQGRLFGQGKDQ